jgi:hypothetical protein
LKISIRQIFEELTTISLLANYIHEQIPLEVTAANSAKPTLNDVGNTTDKLSMVSYDGSANTSTDGARNRASNGQRINNFDVSSIQPNSIISNDSASSSTMIERIMKHQLQVVSSTLSSTLSEIITQQLTVLQGQGVTNPSNSAPIDEDNREIQNQWNASKLNGYSFSHPTSSQLPPTATPMENIAEKVVQFPPDHLQRFIDSYGKRTSSSKAHTQNHRSVLADSRASAGFRPSTKELVYPIIGDQASGAYLWDIDGNKYIDLTMGFGVLLFGHNPQFVQESISAQMERGLQIGPQTQLAGKVAQLITELTGTERVAFCNSGTEAVMTAIRLARHTTGRHKIAIFANSYHGHFDGILAQAAAIPGQSIPSTTGVTPLSVSDVLVLEYGEDSALETLRASAAEIAAVLVEPVQSRNLSLQPREFLHHLRQLTAASGITLIFDEVLLGFRIQQGGAQAWFDIKADLVTYGKIIGGGLPIGGSRWSPRVS